MKRFVVIYTRPTDDGDETIVKSFDTEAEAEAWMAAQWGYGEGFILDTTTIRRFASVKGA